MKGNNMKNKIFCFVLLSFLIFPALLQADVISWQQCAKNALANSGDLAAAKEKLNKALAAKNSSISNILPSVNAGAGYSRNAGGEGYSYSISGSQVIFQGLRNIFSILASDASLMAARAEYDTASALVRHNLKLAYIEVSKQQEAEGITEIIMERRKQQLELVELKYNSGKEHRGAFLNAQASMAQSEADYRQAKDLLVLAKLKLARQMGAELNSDFTVEPQDETFITVQLPDFKNEAMNTSDIKKYQANLEAAKHRVAIARAQFLPSVSASASYGKSGDTWLPQNENWSLGVNISLPILSGLDKLSSLSQAESDLKTAQIALDDGIKDMEIKLREKFINLQSSADEVNVRKKSASAIEERAQIADAQYQTGLMTFDNWAMIQDDLVNSRKSMLAAAASYHGAYSQWLNTIGRKLEDEAE
ncbi:MAG: TolC family protein [Candidatus Goldbacteria bacterium]|nr:TolC family protein [Candidatus Goldiibacteriota bacterium]